MRERGVLLVLALAVDWFVGEPPAVLHPVVWIGRLVRLLERKAPAGETAALLYGAVLTGVTVALSAACAALAQVVVRRLPLPLRLVAGAVLLKSSFAVRGLLGAGDEVARALEAEDLPAARRALRSLCSRDASTLDGVRVASGAVESLAENAVDSAVAPWLAFLVGGLPGAYGYRAANTLDAMIGYHGRYEHLGKVAARLDDLLNLVAARATAGLIVLGAALTGGDAGRAAAIARRDHGATESPNAGWPMSAAAGALGVQLEKVGHYRLGDPLRPVCAADIAAARRVVGAGMAVGVALLLLADLGVRRSGGSA